MTPHEHAAQSRFLLDIIDHPLVAANPQLLSEVLWGAATQMVKAVAKTHNRPNHSHRQLFHAVRWIGRNAAHDPDLLNEFGRIEELHVNFYDGEMNRADIAERRSATIQFFAKMQRILASP